MQKNTPALDSRGCAHMKMYLSVIFLLVYITYTLQWSRKHIKFPNRIYAMIREKDRIN